MSIWDGTSQPEWEREAEARADAWRGDQHENLAELEGSAEQWRGDAHTDDWPESLAGPEYWLNKKRLDDGE